MIFVQPSLAESWTTNYANVVAGTDTRYEVTFYARFGVTFHDGQLNAAAVKANLITSWVATVLAPSAPRMAPDGIAGSSWLK